MIFFTSDTHYFHKNIIAYSNRPFRDLNEMHSELIRRWNEIVDPADTVYHLGDISFGKKEETDKILNQLNGSICLIKGNHDQDNYSKKRFQWIKDYYELDVKLTLEQFIKYQDIGDKILNKIVLFHYGIQSWNKAHHGSFHLHGHSHGSLKTLPNMRRMDVGVDCHNYTPVSLEVILVWMRSRKGMKVDHHG